MKKSGIMVLGVAIIIIGVIAGISIYKKNDISENTIVEKKTNEISEEIIDECTDEWEEMKEEAKLELETNSNEEKISPNCLVILKRNYRQCNHIINEYIDIPQNLVNKTQEELLEEYLNWKVEKYSNAEIILYREFESDCGQHFVLRNDNGKITIYKFNENNEEVIHQKTEISTDYLTEADRLEIENGIRVNGIEELNQLLEDFE